MLLANPHFPWEGALRFWEVHLTVPGEVDVYGVAAHRLARRRHRLHPTTFGVDPHGVGGQPLHRLPARARAREADVVRRRRRGTRDDVEADDDRGASKPDGTTTEHDPDAVVQPLRTDPRLPRGRLDRRGDDHLPRRQHRQRRVPRCSTSAMDRAESMDEFQKVHETYQGVPLFNTIAVDDKADGLVRRHVGHAQPVARGDRRHELAARANDPIVKLAADNRRGAARRLDVGRRSGSRRRAPATRAWCRTAEHAPGRTQRLRVQRQRQLLDAARRPRC